MARAKLTERQQLIKAARDGQPVDRKELPAKITCPRCGSDQWPDENGDPRYHLRAAVQGDPGWSEIVPVMVACED